MQSLLRAVLVLSCENLYAILIFIENAKEIESDFWLLWINQVAKLARSEFDSAVAALRDKGVSVKVFNDVEDRYDQP